MDNNKQDRYEEGITLNDLLRIILKNYILIIALTVACTIMAIIFAYKVATPKYTSTGTVVVMIRTEDTGSTDPTTIDYYNSQKIIQTVADLMLKNIVVDKVVEQLDNPAITNGVIKGSLSIQQTDSNFLIDVSCTSSMKEYCNLIVDSIIENTIIVGNSKELTLLNDAIVKVEEGSKPRYASPNKPLYVIVGFMLGLIMGVAIAFIKELFSSSFRDTSEVERYLNTNIIGRIYDYEKKKIHRSEMATKSFEKNETNYVKIVSAIDFSNVDNKLKVLQVTSSIQSEGKSTISINLVKTMESLKKKVCLIDLDLKRPTINHFYGMPKMPGFTDYAVGVSSEEEIINHISEYTDVIYAGSDTPNSLVLIESDKFLSLINSLREKYDYVIIDTPPVGAVADTLAIGKYSDGIIFVVSQEDSKKKISLETIKQLHQRDYFIVGTVVTKIKKSKINNDYYYYRYYSYENEENK